MLSMSKMATRMLRRIAYGRQDTMKGIRARSRLRSEGKDVTDDAEADLVSQDICRNDTFVLYGHTECIESIASSLERADEVRRIPLGRTCGR